MGVQEVRWDKGAQNKLTIIHFLYGKVKDNNHDIGVGFFVLKRIVSAVNR
jgi:hypothetical protein